MSSRLPELLPEALAAARAISDQYPRAWILAELVLHLPEGMLPEALAFARAISHQGDRAGILAALASRLPELLPEALVQGGNNRCPAWGGP